MSSSVLYDVPGPRAQLRNRILGVITLVLVVAVIGFVVWRFIDTGQFSAAKWNVFSYSAIWERFGQATLATLAAFAVAVQPDRAMAGMLAASLLALVSARADRWSIAASAAAVCAFAATLLRADAAGWHWWLLSSRR